MSKENLLAGSKRSPRASSGTLVYSLPIALMWVIGFSIWFYQFVMPNNDGITRPLLWSYLPYTLLDWIAPPIDPQRAAWSWLFLLERTPFLAVALAIWIGAWGIGSLILRVTHVNLRGAEGLFFSMCVGLSFTSLLMLGLGIAGLISRWALLGIVIAAVLLEVVLRGRASPLAARDSRRDSSPGFFKSNWVVLTFMALLMAGQLIGAMTPQNDFDVIEYHLGGPKEWFQLGQIQRLPHNVYTNFPFLCEMILLAGMTVYGDWQWGALGGQAALAIFAPLTALGLFAAGRRWFSEKTGLIAALIYLSSPWTYRISIIAYTESSLACYLFAALYAVLMLRTEFMCEPSDGRSDPWPLTLLTGMLTGSAMACKYTGFVSVVIPITALLFFCAAQYIKAVPFRRLIKLGLAFGLGIGLTVGPWLVKNLVETGNPVYPLGVRVFGGVDRDPEIDAKWRNGHAAKRYPSWQARMWDLPVKLQDVVSKNDWHSALMFAFAPLTILLLILLRRRGKEEAPQIGVISITWFYIAWQFATWWVLTHHIDRFYVPMFSAVAYLAGVGAQWLDLSGFNPSGLERRSWKITTSLVIVAGLLFNVNLMQSGICGFSAGRLKLLTARDIAISSATPRIRWMHDAIQSGELPSDTKILYAGEAALFHAQYPYLYNTVFDHSILEQICVKPGTNDFELKPAEQIRAELQQRGITHVDVCWSEILRYREPGSYGYTNFVTPDRIRELQKLGILGTAMPLPEWANRIPLSPNRAKQLESEGWLQSLSTRVNNDPAYYSAQIFPVLPVTPAK